MRYIRVVTSSGKQFLLSDFGRVKVGQKRTIFKISIFHSKLLPLKGVFYFNVKIHSLATLYVPQTHTLFHYERIFRQQKLLTLSHKHLIHIEQNVTTFDNHSLDGQIFSQVFRFRDLIVHLS